MPRSDRSALIDAASSFDEQLAVYARLGELFLKTPMESIKQLERANQILGELAESEQRLQDCGQRLIQALSAARQQQETLSAQVIAHAPQLQARNERLKDVMAQMTQLVTDVAEINAQVMAQNGDREQHAAEADPAAVSTAVLALSERAQTLAAAAHDASFEELSVQAHALFQRLKAIGQKLQKAATS